MFIKTAILLLVLGAFSPLTQLQAMHADSINIRLIIGEGHYTINGRRHQGDAAPHIQYGRTMVPLDLIAEGFGAAVEWNGETQTIKISQNEQNISLQIGEALPNNMGVPIIKNGKTFVPAAYIAHGLKWHIHWDGANRAVYILRGPGGALHPQLAISDYGRQVAEDFLRPFTSLFSFGIINADGTYTRQTRSALIREHVVNERPHLVVRPSNIHQMLDRDENIIRDETMPFTRFGLVARDFKLFDINNDGIPEIFIHWTFPTGAEWGADRWTLHLYEDGAFHEHNGMFRSNRLDIFEYDGQLILVQVGHDHTVPLAYTYIELDGTNLTRTTAGIFGFDGQNFHRSREFRDNPTRFDTGGSLVCTHLDVLHSQIMESLRACKSSQNLG